MNTYEIINNRTNPRSTGWMGKKYTFPILDNGYTALADTLLSAYNIPFDPTNIVFAVQPPGVPD